MMTTDALTAVLVVITGIYAALTYGIMVATRRSVRAVEQQTEALSRPYVTVAPLLLAGNAIMFLRITNSGKTAAERLGSARPAVPPVRRARCGKESSSIRGLSRNFRRSPQDQS